MSTMLSALNQLVIWFLYGLFYLLLLLIALVFMLDYVPPLRALAERYILLPLNAYMHRGAWANDPRYWAHSQDVNDNDDDDDDEAPPQLIDRDFAAERTYSETMKKEQKKRK